MRCSLCYKEFNDVQAHNSCSACLLTSGCQMIKCPNCGYEMPVESNWAKKIVNLFQRKKKKNASV